ncbi:YlzJ-like family protein [Alicyclobacillus cycloheptanicus]|uniref:YlzJ-like protein n=1 Tax=Alicyclobacillus cycloheptanicus TaxID=1457 RepID=A0ABT9XG98_9BACL|nr:YlzJ-like family protein [Alicyclobacillus cycloheptanicus]MDQ0189285.1 hypothetical protein [Alicyclobacillus cycloheptanicus]WDM01351.1 YlzJ-like family protein [Alicyclobacillus cycloheptanicus]
MSILWSVLAPEEIWAGYGEVRTPPQEIQYGGVTMLVTPLGDGTGRVERLISPNPADYLRRGYQPGTRIQMPLNNDVPTRPVG